MWTGTANQLEMVEGDYGIILPFTIKGVLLSQHDKMVFSFKRRLNGETILTKEYSNITNNTVNLSLTSQESKLFNPGNYVYTLDWYQQGVFQSNLISCGHLKVVDKA